MKSILISVFLILNIIEANSQTKRIYHRRHSGTNKTWQTNSKISKPKTSSHNFGLVYEKFEFSSIDSIILISNFKCIQFYTHLTKPDTIYNYKMKNINELKKLNIKIIDKRNPKA